jgi:hypothetical protein
MAVGMACHSRLSVALGEAAVDLGGAGKSLEVHPTYGFRSLLGVVHDHERVRCDPDRLLRPKAPRGSLGHLQRIEILRVLLDDLAIPWTTACEQKLRSGLDWTDAAMSAALAAMRGRGATQGVGDPAEGTIMIADPSKLAPLAQRFREAVLTIAAPERPSQPPNRSPRGTSPSAHDCADCAVLRLGKNGLGSLSQEETLSALRGQHAEEQIILPVGVRAIGREWIERAASGGFWLLISYGRLKLAVHVVEVIGEGRTRRTPKENLLGENRDAWRDIRESEYWLRCDDMLEDIDVPTTAVSTRQRGSWTPGMPPNQSPWLAVRFDDVHLRRRLQRSSP